MAPFFCLGRCGHAWQEMRGQTRDRNSLLSRRRGARSLGEQTGHGIMCLGVLSNPNFAPGPLAASSPNTGAHHHPPQSLTRSISMDWRLLTRNNTTTGRVVSRPRVRGFRPALSRRNATCCAHSSEWDFETRQGGAGCPLRVDSSSHDSRNQTVTFSGFTSPSHRPDRPRIDANGRALNIRTHRAAQREAAPHPLRGGPSEICPSVCRTKLCDGWSGVGRPVGRF